MATKLTLADIEQMEDEFLKPEIIASVIGCSAQRIRNQADDDVKSLGFPVSKVGHGYWIPKQGFLNWARWVMCQQVIIAERREIGGNLGQTATGDHPQYRGANR